MAAAYKARTTVVQTFNQGISVFDDFLTANSATLSNYSGLYFASLVTAGGIVDNGSSETYPGWVNLHVDTTNDKAALTFTAELYTDNSSVLVTETRLTVDALINGSNNAQAYYGFTLFSNSVITSTSYAAVFVYDNSLSPNWIVRVNKAGVATQLITTIPVSTIDTYLKVYITPNFVYFFINNILVGTIAVAIPAGIPLTPTWFLNKGTGTQNIDIKTDAVGVYQQFINPRIFSNTTITQ